MQCITHYHSPLGKITLAADKTGLTGLWFEGQKYFALHRGRVCQDTFCGFSKLNDLSVKKSPKTSCLQMS